MNEIISYDIKPTKLIPNSPKQLLLYKNVFVQDGKVDITRAYDTFLKNGWDVQWVTRYGRTQRSHYHPETHEAMIVVSGPGSIRWGVADLDDDDEKHTYGDAREEGGLLMEVNVGDVLIVPAGVAHKNYDPFTANPDFKPLTGKARGIESDDPRAMVQNVELEGFTMMGAYPRGLNWSWEEKGDPSTFEACWNVEVPTLDPVFGVEGGIRKYWN